MRHKKISHYRKKSQSTLEYAILIAIIAAVLLTMQVYFKRGVQGKIRSSADDIGEQFSTAGTLHVETTSFSNTHESVDGGVTVSNLNLPETLNRTEILNLLMYNEDYWGNSELDQ